MVAQWCPSNSCGTDIVVFIERDVEVMKKGIKNPQKIRAKLGDSFPTKKRKKKTDWKKGKENK